ncbi:NTP transferase domain-containing protein [Belnapia sp. T18]|uniref:NTP transferase domain-containing protein n=1 Tax=Belnapia arida TaxID=2804533 RepID=A0ABS1U8S7_9PROT|nr:NTP transferase domain-containing protein [Belnapia arida]MBL6081092.1 NTP transferase domain-containing protein [Belnapia arida]
MQIVIPMSGFGERFRRAGYQVPKPLIEVDGRPIIAHVLDLFPGETDVTFICNADHLAEPEYGMERILRDLCPGGRIVAIPPHRFGPVHAVMQAADMLDPDRPVVVNYCDFACYWSWPNFADFVRRTNCAGAIPAYAGFHPHSLGSTFYAYLRHERGWVRAIQEKQPFTDQPMAEYASSGTYYFATASLMRAAFEAACRQELSVSGEFYVSLAYRPLLDAGLPVAVYELQHFMQWGTPADLEEYRRWSAAFAALADPPTRPEQRGAVLVPMAGAGQRFRAEGYAAPKPLIPVSGRPMALQATADLPRAPTLRAILRRDLPAADSIGAALQAEGAEVVLLDGLTDGQARTCLLGLDGLDPEEPLTIGACDNGMLYPPRRFAELLAPGGPDVLVWGVRGHPEARRRPSSYGWIAADPAGRIQRVAVKEPLFDPATDPIVVGAFTFRRARDLAAAVRRMIGRDARVKGEFYLDTCINDAIALGLDCRLLEIDHYLGWGTPDELRTFQYWQSCFHKWDRHPYRLQRDSRVPEHAMAGLAAEYAARPSPEPRPARADDWTARAITLAATLQDPGR